MPSAKPREKTNATQGRTRPLARALAFVIRTGLTLVIVALVAYFVDWSQFLQTIQSVHLPTLFLAGLLGCGDRVLMSYKWGLLLRVQGVPLSLWQNLSVYSASALAGMVLPSTVGGDALRAIWMSRRGAQAAAVTSSVVFERLIGFAVASLFGIAGITYLFLLGDRAGPLRTIFGLLLALTAALLLGLMLSFSGFLTKRFGQLLKTYVSERLFDIIQPFHRAYTAYRYAPGPVGAFVGLSVLRQFVMLAVDYTVVLALGLDVGPATVCAALAVTFMIARIPIAVTDIGLQEGVLILLLLPAGLQPADIVAMSAVVRILSIVVVGGNTLAALLTGTIDSATFRRRAVVSSD